MFLETVRKNQESRIKFPEHLENGTEYDGWRRNTPFLILHIAHLVTRLFLMTSWQICRVARVSPSALPYCYYYMKAIYIHAFSPLQKLTLEAVSGEGALMPLMVTNEVNEINRSILKRDKSACHKEESPGKRLLRPTRSLTKSQGRIEEKTW